MKVNNSINVLFLAFCVLLLGFVYVNTRFMDEFELKRSTDTKSPVTPDETDINKESEKILE